MIRLGWKRFLVLGLGSTALSLPFGLDATGAVFFVAAVATIAGIVQSAGHYRPRYRSIWFILAASIGLFLVGGVAELVTTPAEAPIGSTYPGWREPFDLLGYIGCIVGVELMARARQAGRDRTITLDALISMGGVGALAWATVMSSYLDSDRLTLAGKATGITFTTVALLLGFVTIRVAIGPGARPMAYRFLSVAVAGAFVAEISIELQLSGRAQVPGSETFSTVASAIAVIAMGAGALHPTMAALTEPPIEVTPNMTPRRLVAMTVAVLIPPMLLMAEPTRRQNLQSLAIIGVWAALSVMVMIRIFALARTRERFAELDRALAEAEASLAGAPDRAAMVGAVLTGGGRIVSRLGAISVHLWQDGGWGQVGIRGRARLPPVAVAPADPPGPSGWSRRPAELVLDIHFRAGGAAAGVVTVATLVQPDPLELARLSLLVGDLGRALESAAMREDLGRERSERRFRALVENSADIIMVIDDQQVVRFVSPAGARLLQRPEAEIVGLASGGIVAPDHRARFETVLDRPGGEAIELQLVTGTGSGRWFEVSSADMRYEPEIGGIVVTASEVSARKQAQLDLERSEARFRSLVQHASDLVAVLDISGIVSWVSPSAQRILGRQPAEVVDRSILDFTHPKDRDQLGETIFSPGSRDQPETGELEVRLRDERTGWRTLEVTVTDLLDEPSVAGIVLNAHDVTERKVLERNLRHQALHDDLTGLGNRVMFRQRIAEAVAADGDRFAVLVIDIDDFKTINDGLGHSVGDQLLQVVAARLTSSLRPTDTAVRLGGDEFAVLITASVDRSHVLGAAQRLLGAIEEPTEVSGREIALKASIGVAFATDVATPTPETMLRGADLAMYGAKSRGKARVTVFDESMHEGAFERLELRADLARALERGELLLHYQPVVDLGHGTIAGFEALMRWHHPTRGMVGPGTFIPLAEETGLIVPIGRWLIDVALAQLRRWQDEFPAPDPLTMAINVSGRQLEDEGIVSDIAAAIARAGVAPSSVIIELTESVLVEDTPVLVRRLHQLRETGVGLHADDFGTGFASYAALQSLPFTGVKIDRSLINGLDGDSVDRAEAQIRSIIEMSATTRMRVVAEGIESGSQAHVLRQLNCGHAQGFYFARPAEANAIESQLRERAAGVT